MRFRVLGFAFLVAGVAFGQSVTATKAYVDRRYTEATNAVASIVTNEVSSGWSDWSYTPEIEYFENEEIVSIVPMEWVESGDDPECRFPCWKLQAVTRAQNEVGEVREFESVYYSGYYWKSQGYDDAIVVLATDVACDTCIKATRKPLAKNALGLARAEDLEKLPDHETVTNVARAVSNSFWDERNEVLWRLEFRDGEPMFVPITNENVKASGGLL